VAPYEAGNGGFFAEQGQIRWWADVAQQVNRLSAIVVSRLTQPGTS
jgi:hypothetical protein